MTVKNNKKVNSAKKGNKKAVVENEVKKPTLKNTTTKVSSKPTENKTTPTEKKTTSKVSSKPTEKKVLKKTTTKVSSKKAVQKEKEQKTPKYAHVESIAMMFPEEIHSKELGVTLKKVAVDKFHTYKELKDALDKNEGIFFASYWNKEQTATMYEFNYDTEPPKSNSFPNDLDVSQAVLPLETQEKVVAISLYTEALSIYLGKNLKPVADVNLAGEKVHFRAINGLPYDIYTPVKK